MNEKIWNLFSQLMNEDCLNSAKPDQFLPMKNMLKIKLENETGGIIAAEAAADDEGNDEVE